MILGFNKNLFNSDDTDLSFYFAAHYQLLNINSDTISSCRYLFHFADLQQLFMPLLTFLIHVIQTGTDPTIYTSSITNELQISLSHYHTKSQT